MDLRPAEWGSDHHFAWQQSSAANVRFGGHLQTSARTGGMSALHLGTDIELPRRHLR